MVSTRLVLFWAFFAFALLAASGVLIAFSIIFRMPNLLLNFVIDPMYLIAGMVLGIAYGVTFALSIGAIVQPVHVTIGLVIVNWALLVDAIGTVAIGTMIWFFTLKERANYEVKFNAASETVRQAIQDKFSCCGYFDTSEGVVNAGFCQDPTFSATQQSCVGPLTDYADYTLNNIFTSTYGFMAIIAGLFLLTTCVINKRILAERFRKIDMKRGGKGFV